MRWRRCTRAGSWDLLLVAETLVVASLWCGCNVISSDGNPAAPTGGASGTNGRGGAPTGGGPDPGVRSDWCSAKMVLRDNCESCHGAQPVVGAQHSLVTIDDLRGKAKMSSKFVYELVKERIHDMEWPMPPRVVNDPLTPAEMGTLDAWIAAGAQPANCNVGVDAAGGAGGSSGQGGSGQGGAAGRGGGGAGGNGGWDGGAGRADGGAGTGGWDGGGPDGSAGSGGSGTGTGGSGGGSGADGGTGDAGRDGGTTGWPTDCEQRHSVRAHGLSQPNDTTKFNVSSAPNRQFSQCFLFKAPWGTDTVQALRFRPMIDDARVVHHFTLYGIDNGSGPDGQVGGSGCSDGKYLHGWAPGGLETDFPPDVGLQMPKGANAYLALEIHYDNTANHPNALDATGLEFCTTKTLRPHTAAVQWLGSTNISVPARSQRDVVGVCDPVGTQPVHIVGLYPRMHQLGTHARLVINRAQGARETLLDAPFQFEKSQTYQANAVVRNGDTLATTCTYYNGTGATVSYGPNAEDEQCYVFVTAYPPGGLSGLFTADRCVSLF